MYVSILLCTYTLSTSRSPQFQKMSWERKNRSNVSAAAGSSKQDDDAMDTTGYDEDSSSAGYTDAAAGGQQDDSASGRDAHAAAAEAAFRTLPRASSWKRG
jgi:hypothetical protein